MGARLRGLARRALSARCSCRHRSGRRSGLCTSWAPIRRLRSPTRRGCARRSTKAAIARGAGQLPHRHGRATRTWCCPPPSRPRTRALSPTASVSSSGCGRRAPPVGEPAGLGDRPAAGQRVWAPTGRTRAPADVMREIAEVVRATRASRYDRLEAEGLQWPCPESTDAGTAISARDGFAGGKAAFAPVGRRRGQRQPTGTSRWLAHRLRAREHHAHGSADRAARRACTKLVAEAGWRSTPPTRPGSASPTATAVRVIGRTAAASSVAVQVTAACRKVWCSCPASRATAPVAASARGRGHPSSRRSRVERQLRNDVVRRPKRTRAGRRALAARSRRARHPAALGVRVGLSRGSSSFLRVVFARLLGRGQPVDHQPVDGPSGYAPFAPSSPAGTPVSRLMPSSMVGDRDRCGSVPLSTASRTVRSA